VSCFTTVLFSASLFSEWMASEIKACWGLVTSEMWPLDRGRWYTFCGMKLVSETGLFSKNLNQITFLLVYIESNCFNHSIRQDWFSVTLCLRELSRNRLLSLFASKQQVVAANEKNTLRLWDFTLTSGKQKDFKPIPWSIWSMLPSLRKCLQCYMNWLISAQ